MKKILFSILFLLSSSAYAAVIEFVPPNDPTGHVLTTNTNDGWSIGRGVVFQATTSGTISSIGLYHDLTSIDLSYKISQTTSADGDIETGETILASGNAIVTTSGLEWIDFQVGSIQFAVGNFYHIEFEFSGNGNQNFFYDNDNVRFSQDGFVVIDGTNAGSTGNSVMPAIRLDVTEANAVPVPTLGWWGITILLILMASLAYIHQRKTAAH